MISKNLPVLLVFCLFLGGIKNAPLFADFYTQKSDFQQERLELERGFYFFEDPDEEAKKKKEVDASFPVPNTPQEAFLLQEEVKQKETELLAFALFNNTLENVQRYLEFHNRVIDMTSSLSVTGERAILNNPHLDHTLKIPTNTPGIALRKHLEYQKKQQTLETLKARFSLLLFVKGGEPFSEQAANIAKTFGDLSGWEVQTVSCNNFPVEAFPDFIKDKGIAAKYNIQDTPIFLMVDPKTGQNFKVGAGPIALDQLFENICIQSEANYLEDSQ